MFLRILLIIFIFASEYTMSSEVFVYMPTSVKADTLELAFKNNCPNLNVTVFDHVKKFEENIAKEKPAGIVTFSTNIFRQENYEFVRRGEREGKLDEPYVFASLNNAVDIEQVDSLSIGVVSFLNRKDMKSYLAELFGVNIRLRGVQKREDLLLLLLYGSVDVIFVPEYVFREIKNISKVNLISSPANVSIMLAGAAILKDKKDLKIEKCIDSLPKQTNSLLGVDSWRKG